MTIDERRMSIAYTDLIQVGELIQHVIRVNACELLSDERKRDLASAELALGRVRGEIEKYVSSHTDLDDGYGSDTVVTEKKKEKSRGPCNGHGCIHDKESCPRYKMFLASGAPAVESCNFDMSSCGGASSGYQSPKSGC